MMTNTKAATSQRKTNFILDFTLTLPLVVFIVLCLIARSVYLNATYSYFSSGMPFIGIGLVALVSLLGAGVSYQGLPRAVTIAIRATLSFSVFYILTSRMVLPQNVIGESVDAGIIVNYLWIPGAFFGVLGFIRPSFGLFSLHYLIWQKQSLSEVFGIPITAVDYVTVVDTCGLIIMGCILLPFFSRLQRFSTKLNKGFDADQRPIGNNLALLEALFLAAIALHFGNYFYSAIGKMIVGENLFYWIYGNETEFLILASLETGVNPLSFSSGLTKIAYEAFAPTSWLINLATFTGQAVCLFTIVRPRLAMWTTVFFDLMHAGIFVFTGIFFWKYILLNLAIVFGLKKMLNRKVPNLFALVLILLVIISPFLFHITFFYWLDSPAMNSVRIFAFDKAGREYRVPASNFLSMSVTFNQHRLIHPHSGPFPTWTWGTTLLLHEMYDGQRCTLEQITPDMPKNKYFVPKEIITRAIQKYHLFMMANIDENGYWAYDLYPHHIFSVPWAFKEYRQLDKREIVGYKYSIEAVCLGYENSTFTREVIWRGGFDIELVQ